MNLYFAPLEGITGYIFRNTHHKLFDGCDCYYAPFITPAETEKNSLKNLRGILPENNVGVPLKIQALTNNSKAFLEFANVVYDLGYDEININIGCPSQTVVKKGKGAGLLKDTEKLDSFLNDIINKTDMKISVKTRVGISDYSEMDSLMEIYNKYPLSLLIIHPRLREDFYNGTPHINTFQKAYDISKNDVCYNGDILTKEHYEKIISDFPDLKGVMIGRGAVKNPAIFREIKGGKKLSTNELLTFSDALSENYLNLLKSEKFTLQKMKEVWALFMGNFPEEKKILKAIKKANRLQDIKNASNCLPEL